ncbi:peptidase M50 [uncultured Oscillibacter sp.]|uniref:peptidase M50 n=1 Tax=uncultured Oscillibacter sp. TaxID=876091 RepID=UPI0025E661D0|nr:peptidase M50 [uncultured Oscillibacter sp.]
MSVSGGFWILLGWFLLGNGWAPLAAVLSAAGLHEAGHYLVLRLLGAQVRSVHVGVLGMKMEVVPGRLSYGGELAAVLAGPAVNLLCGTVLAAAGERWLAAAGAHLALAMFNLLPIRPLDGGRALTIGAVWLAGPERGERAARWVSCCCAAVLAAVLAALMWVSGGSLWLLPPAAAALAAACREMAGKRRFL